MKGLGWRVALFLTVLLAMVLLAHSSLGSTTFP